MNWNLRYMSKSLIEPGQTSTNSGYLATPGQYTATLTKTAGGVVTELDGPISFDVVPLHEPTLTGASPDAILAFQEQLAELQNQMTRFSDLMEEQVDKVDAMMTAVARAKRPSVDLTQQLQAARETLHGLDQRVRGYRSKSEIGERNPPSPQSRLSVGSRGLSTTYGPTEMHRQAVETGRAELISLRAELDEFIRTIMGGLESSIQTVGAPPIKGP